MFKGSDVMDYHELDKMAQRARRETETFINTNIHNQTKEWPRICRSQLFMENTRKSPCTLGQNNCVRDDYNFDTQVLEAIS